jgi:signal-transduction protein with cAMP-binding, CBS, and nucleotidyltransferase domain
MSVKIDLEGPISNYIVKKLLTMDENETVVAASKKMAQNDVGSLIVTRKEAPVGIVTERDILNKVVAAERNPSKTKLSEVMTSPIKTIDHSARVGDAISMMVKSGVRRLAVVQGGKIVGLISQRGLVSGGGSEKLLLPELETPGGVRCPYCGELLDDPKQLSRHIDLIHIGRGLLQGDMSKW